MDHDIRPLCSRRGCIQHAVDDGWVELTVWVGGELVTCRVCLCDVHRDLVAADTLEGLSPHTTAA